MTGKELKEIINRIQWAHNVTEEEAKNGCFDPLEMLMQSTKSARLNALCYEYLHDIEESTERFLQARKTCL